MLCSFDLTSGDKRKVALATVREAEPGTVSQVPPCPVDFGLLLLLVLATSVS
jgi:hypothetical protein